MDENEKYTDPGEQALFDEEMTAVMDDPLGGYAPPSENDDGDEAEEDGGDTPDEEEETPAGPEHVHEENEAPAEPSATEDPGGDSKTKEVSEPEEPEISEATSEDNFENAPDEEKKLVLSEFSYISRKIRELESKINTVALSIEESADTVDRVNRSMKAMLESIQETESIMENKVSDFQDGTESWGADMNRVAENVRQACRDSRGFLSDELKHEMKRLQEDIIRTTTDGVRGETASVLTEARDNYEELLDQVVTNYRQFCKASSQHQKDLMKKGYFEEVRQLRRILYGVLIGQFVVFALLVIFLVMRR